MIVALCIYVTVTHYALAGNALDLAAFGGRVEPGKTCAVSRDLAHLAGREIWIEGEGVRLVNDKMGAGRRKGVDVAVGGRKEALEKGKRKRVRVCW